MKKILSAWQHTFSDKNVATKRGTTLITMTGNSNSTFYLCIPKKGFHSRTASYKRYGRGTKEFFVDGKFVAVAPYYRESNARTLYNEGKVTDSISYLNGSLRFRNPIIK